MRIDKNAARDTSLRKRVTVEIGRGAKAVARTLDAFEVKFVAAQARAELNAAIAGEESPAGLVWTTLTPKRLDEAREDETYRQALLNWMHSVLTATRAVESLEGVEESTTDESGVVTLTPMQPSFEAFELIFLDADAEVNFRVRAGSIERLWSAEKNVSGPGSNGSGPTENNSAAPAEKPETPAPTAESETTANDAPSSPTPATPQKENSPGSSPQAPDSGSSLV